MGIQVNGGYIAGTVAELTIGLTGGLAELTLPLSAVTLIVKVTVPTDHTFSGMTGGEDGRVVIIVNDSRTWKYRLSLEHVGSAAANRFADDDGFDAFIEINPGGSVAVIYDGASFRWRIMPML